MVCGEKDEARIPLDPLLERTVAFRRARATDEYPHTNRSEIFQPLYAGQAMSRSLSSDPQVNRLFDFICDELCDMFGYTPTEAWELIDEYHRRYTDSGYCAKLGMGVQDDGFFFHQGVLGMAFLIEYIIHLNGDPNTRDFLRWRAKLTERLKGA